jgi:hypothetical protein
MVLEALHLHIALPLKLVTEGSASGGHHDASELHVLGHGEDVLNVRDLKDGALDAAHT